MAYLIGIVNPDEAAELQARGWELEEISEKFLEELSQTVERTNGTEDKVLVAFVDTSLFKIMDGPDWEKT